MMKTWRYFAAVGLAALYLSGCQGKASGNGSDTAATQAQESAGAQKEAAEESHAAEEEMHEDGAEEAAEETPAADADEIKGSNPMQEVSGPEALSSIGVSMDVPENAEAGECFIISQVVAEVNFTFADNPYTYRGSATAEDFAGIFEEFEETVTSIAATDEMPVEKELTIKTTISGGKLAIWSKNGANYTLYTPAAVETDALVALCQELINKN